MEKIQDIDTREWLYDMVPKNGIGAELGVCRGQNAVQLFFRTKPSLMYLVDIWKELDGNKKGDPNIWYGDHHDYIGKLFKDEIEKSKIVLYKGYTVDFLNSIEDSHLDWAYVDSNHHYQCINRELAILAKKVKKGGIVMGHDYCNSPPNPKGFGSSIVRAVNERVQNGDFKMKAVTKEEASSYFLMVN